MANSGSDNDTYVGVNYLTHRGGQSSIPGFPPSGLCLSDTACTSLRSNAWHPHVCHYHSPQCATNRVVEIQHIHETPEILPTVTCLQPDNDVSTSNIRSNFSRHDNARFFMRMLQDTYLRTYVNSTHSRVISTMTNLTAWYDVGWGAHEKWKKRLQNQDRGRHEQHDKSWRMEAET